MSGERFSILFKQHSRDIFLFARSLTRSRANAEDIVQNAAIKAYENRNRIRQSSSFKAWISTIVYNTYLSQYRKRKRRRKLMEERGKYSDSFFNRIQCRNLGLERLKEQDILHLSRRVGKRNLQAFSLYLDGYSYKEISERLDIALGTVKSRIHAARTKMKELTKNSGIAAQNR